MIKKQLLCSSVVLMLVAAAKLYSYNTASNDLHIVTEARKAERIVSEMKGSAAEIEEENAWSSYFASLSFVNKTLPVDNERVENALRRHLRTLSYNNTGTYRLHRLAASSLPKIASILKAHGIPEDFKYIPLVESGLEQGTSSHKGASGYWQFMPATARSFGLRVDEVVDERQDLEKSTQAAAKYLKALYREFGDWTLVAAAYNVGEGRLAKTIKAQGKEDYFNLHINKETDAYVYKLISMKAIIENPEQHGYNRGRTIMAQALQGSETGNETVPNRL